MACRAVARVVLPEEVGPERARRMGVEGEEGGEGGEGEEGVVVVVVWLAVGG